MEKMTERTNMANTGESVTVETVRVETAQDPQAAQGTPESAVVTKRTLFRHPSNKLLGGVCGGMADYFDWDPALVRILWVVATLTTGGGGFLAYLALWILLPVGTADAGQQSPPAIELNERNLGRAAYLLIGLGGLWLLANLGILPWLWGSFWRIVGTVFWPALLIGAGYLLLRRTSSREWRFSWRDTSDRFKNRMNVKMPTKSDMKDGLKQAKQRLPLKRSRTDRMFMGVCGGIAQRLGIDANLVRLVWVAFSVGSIGMGVLIYVLMGLLLPEEAPVSLQSYRENDEDMQVIDVSAGHIV